MVFAILFILAFLIGAAIYYVNRQWVVAVVIPMLLFVINSVLDPGSSGGLLFTLVFGLTIVFFASLLGCYIVQTRTAIAEEIVDDKEYRDSP